MIRTFKGLLKRFLPLPAKTANQQYLCMTAKIDEQTEKLSSVERQIVILYDKILKIEEIGCNLKETLGAAERSIIETNNAIIERSISKTNTAIERSITETNNTIVRNHKETRDAIKNSFSDSNNSVEKHVNKLTDELRLIDANIEKRTNGTKKLIDDIQKQQSVIVPAIAGTLKRNTIRHLDIHIVDHCNLNCKSCSAYAPIKPKQFIMLETLQADLVQLHSVVGDNILQIHLLGGEPLLHPEAEQIAFICRSVFKDAQIDFTTNGLLIYDMSQSFWKTLHEQDIAIKYTRYPIDFDYDKMIEYIKSKGVFVFSAGWEIKSFRRLPLNTKGTFNNNMSYLRCPYIDCPQLRDGKLYRCPPCAFMDVLNNSLHEASQSKDRFHLHMSDYLDIYQIKSSEEVYEFLSYQIPFCRYCDMDSLSWFPWGSSNRDINEWVDI